MLYLQSFHRWKTVGLQLYSQLDPDNVLLIVNLMGAPMRLEEFDICAITLERLD